MDNADLFCYIRSVDYPEGAVVPKRAIRISPDDRGFYFADGVYEVLRTYRGKLFHFHEHLQRFKNSLRAVRIQLPDIERLQDLCIELLTRNNLKKDDVFFYIQATRGTAPRNLLFPAPPVLPTLYISVMPIEPPLLEREVGIKVITVPDIRWQRCDIKAIGLLASVLARQTAADAGAQEALFVRDGVVTEGTHTNIFGVKNRAVITHPLDKHILPGVTRLVVLKLCTRTGISVLEQTLTESDLYSLEELFVTSTTWEVVPVVMVNNRPIGSGKPGPVTRLLQNAFARYTAEVSADNTA